MIISRLQYISQGNTPKEHLINIQDAIGAGCDWVQLRMKNIEEKLYLETAIEAKKITSLNGAKLIINDNVKVALACGAEGIHLGKEDLEPEKARKQVGDSMIIGGTANTLQDVLWLHKQGVNYVGLGPFRYTTTKNVLSPTLGVSGLSDIMLSVNQGCIHTPIVAIGGIKADDIEEIRSTGIYGVAVASAITHSEDKKTLITRMKNGMTHGSISNKR